MDLKDLVERIETKGVHIQIEDRNISGWCDYGFPNKHVEILKYRNKSDSDLWDGVILGYTNCTYEINTKIGTNALSGIILVEDGNHKLVFKIPYKRGFDEKLFSKEVKLFVSKYKKENGLKTRFLNTRELKTYLQTHGN